MTTRRRTSAGVKAAVIAAVWVCVGLVAAATLSEATRWAVWLLAAAGASALSLWLLFLLPTDLGETEKQADRIARSLLEASNASDITGEEDVANPTLERLARADEAVRARIETVRADRDDLRAVFDEVDGPVIASDGGGVVRACNRAGAEFFSRSPAEIVGRTIDELFSQSEIIDLHAAALGGALRRAQVRIQRPGGMRVFQVVAGPVSLKRGGERAGVVLTLRDVTELAAAVQLKTDFVANASHELRTPLASIKAAVETLQDGGAELLPRMTELIAGNVARLEDLTRDLLDLSRLESPEVKAELAPADLRQIATSVASMFERECAERKLTIELDLDPETIAIETDEKLLSLILRNLVENSVKFAYEDTAIRIESRPLESEDARRGLRLMVVDKGIGIPLNHQGRIFERFYQADPARSGPPQRRGTGLGLAIVKHAVKALGGTVGVASVWKEGTTMTVDLPGCIISSPP